MRMKAQMSLEMLAYLAIAGLSMLYSAKAVSMYYSNASGSMESYGYSRFVEAINTAILQGDGSASVSIPAGLCNSTLSGDQIKTPKGSFYFVRAVEIGKAVLCSSGFENVSIEYGQYNVSVGWRA